MHMWNLPITLEIRGSPKIDGCLTACVRPKSYPFREETLSSKILRLAYG